MSTPVMRPTEKDARFVKSIGQDISRQNVNQKNSKDVSTLQRTEKKAKMFWGQVYGASLLVTPDDAMPDSGVFPTPLSPLCWPDISLRRLE